MKQNTIVTIIPVSNGFIVTDEFGGKVGERVVFESRGSMIEYLEHHFTQAKAAEVKEG